MANIEDVEMVDPEQDTRVKTHIIPINVQAKHNTFDIFLSQPSNVLSNAITFVDLNLKGTPVIPVPFGRNKPRGLGKPKELSLKTRNFKGQTDRNLAALNTILEHFPEIRKKVEEG